MKRLPKDVVAAITTARSLGVRSGDRHKHTNVWVVVIGGRVFVRSWNEAPTGWFRAFLRQPRGWIRVKTKEWPAIGKRVRAAALLTRVSSALARKYPHPGAKHYIAGFREPRRRATTLELISP